MVVPVYPGSTVLRLKFNQKPNLFSFLEIFKAQKFGMGFFGDESFVLEFFWVLLEALWIFWIFIWPHSCNLKSRLPPEKLQL